MIGSRDPDKYQHVWLGGYVSNSEARVFHNWRIEEFDTPDDATHRFGADWGFATDPTVLVRCHVIGRTIMWITKLMPWAVRLWTRLTYSSLFQTLKSGPSLLIAPDLKRLAT
jgi:hypothetical protein